MPLALDAACQLVNLPDGMLEAAEELKAEARITVDELVRPIHLRAHRQRPPLLLGGSSAPNAFCSEWNWKQGKAC